MTIAELVERIERDTAALRAEIAEDGLVLQVSLSRAIREVEPTEPDANGISYRQWAFDEPLLMRRVDKLR